VRDILQQLWGEGAEGPSIPSVFGKFSQQLGRYYGRKVIPWMLLNTNFLNENWQYPHAGWEKYFPNCNLSANIFIREHKRSRQ
jgi:hypothetical protein